MLSSLPINRVLRRGLKAMATVFGGIGLMATPALADPQPPPPPGGSIIISRDVGPRNALAPEVGIRHFVATTPDPADFAFSSEISAITDAQAAEISGATGVFSNIGSTMKVALDVLSGNDQIGTERAGGQSGGFIANTVGNSIAEGMGALSGVLGNLPQTGQ